MSGGDDIGFSEQVIEWTESNYLYWVNEEII